MDLRKLIDIALDNVLPHAGEEPRKLHRAMRYSVFSGGKRLRPIFVLESARACGGNHKNAMPAACAVELAHTYSLIYDDLPAMDDDNWRRGKPSCHKAFGEDIAILAGGALLTLAFGVLARHNGSGAEMVKVLSDAIGSRGMAGGQALDMGQRDNRGRRAEINRLKTGKLFEISARLGAMSAGAGKKKEDQVAKYGALFGAAFQIADDLSDGQSYKKSPEKTRAATECRALVKKAKGALKRFGSRSAALVNIADKIEVADV